MVQKKERFQENLEAFFLRVGKFSFPLGLFFQRLSDDGSYTTLGS